MVEVAARFNKDTNGPNREYYHMSMVTVPETDSVSLDTFDNIPSEGVASFSIPTCSNKGGLSEGYHRPRLDHIVASWGDCSFYNFNLSEDVWMTMGLTPRCVGGDDQRIVYDDLSVPVIGVAKGEISSEFYYQPSRDIHWKMKNDYLRQYLWQKGHVGVRAFYYEGYVQKPEAYEPLLDDGFFSDAPEAGWYDLRLVTTQHGILFQAQAAVIAITPDRCEDRDVHELIWPGDDAPMTKARTEKFPSQSIYLRDSFLEKYEKNSVYSSMPYKYYDKFGCSPGYKGQWDFTECTRVGRNLIRTPVRELYKPKPDAEIFHAFSYAITEEEAKQFDFEQEHIVSKVFRFVDEIVGFGNNLHALAGRIGAHQHTPEEYTGFSPAEIEYSHWAKYPILSKLAQVAPLDMPEQDFLSRCKTLSEVLGRIKSGPLRRILVIAGCDQDHLSKLRGFKLIEVLSNLLEYLAENLESVEAFEGCAPAIDWKQRSRIVAPIFITNDLRNADAHESVKQCIDALERIGFDHANLSDGYGLALDYVFDRVVESLATLNSNMEKSFNQP